MSTNLPLSVQYLCDCVTQSMVHAKSSACGKLYLHPLLAGSGVQRGQPADDKGNPTSPEPIKTLNRLCNPDYCITTLRTAVQIMAG